MKKEKLKKKLQKYSWLEVEYTKKNGETRLMRITEKIENVPVEHHPKGTGTPYIGDLVTVYDSLADEGYGGWRRIDADNVKLTKKDE